jgi:hypothetical protein
MKRALWIVVLAGIAEAQVSHERLALSDALMADDGSKLVERMADPFDARGLFFSDEACAAYNKPQKLSGDKRKGLADCIIKHGFMLSADRGKGTVWIDHANEDKTVYTAYELELKTGKLTSMQSAASTTAAERRVRTIKRFTKVPFKISAKTQAAAEKLPERTVGFVVEPAKIVDAWHKICFDEAGKVTSRRLTVSSGLAAFDKETTAAVAALKTVDPLMVAGKAQPACEIVHLDNYE